MTSARDQQIRALYRAALERPPAERAAFVAELSGGDVEIVRSVERLLSEQGAATELGSGTSAATSASADLQPGAMLGHYRVDAVLGRGGMGVVYRTTDTKLNRPVAIKFLSIAVADAQAKRRFQQEAATASGLNHPHIVTVHDVGEHDGQQFIVSELVDGGTLEDWSLAHRRRGWRQSVELVTGVADAIAAAHAAGVLHRDIKPGNILIGRNGYAKLADFGLAKLLDRGNAGQDLLAKRSHDTRAGVVIGTIAYMSPEQAAGQPLDARSDIFSFGIVLYELLAGRQPFEGANELEQLKNIVHAEPAPLPYGVPELLRMAVDKALEKDPADRYQTMRDLVADLRRVTRKSSNSQSGSRELSDAQVVAAVVGRHRRVVLGGVLGVVLLIAGGIYLALSGLAPRGGTATAGSGTRDYRITQLTRTGDAISPALSPDGRYVVYSRLQTGGLASGIWVRQVATSTDVAVVPAEPGVIMGLPTVTPDGEFIDFIRGGDSLDPPGIWRVPFIGGTPQRVARNVFSAVGWAPDGRRMAFVRVDVASSTSQLVVADADGRNERVLLTRQAPSYLLSLWIVGTPLVRPVWSPDGAVIALLNLAPEFTPQVLFVDVATGNETARPSGGAPLPQGLAWLGPSALVLSQSAIFGGRSQLFRMSYPDGTVTPLTNDLAAYISVDVDARGSLVTTQREIAMSLWVGDASGSTGRDLAAAPYPSPSGTVAWAADRVFYTAGMDDRVVMTILTPESGARQELMDGFGPAPTADGNAVVFMRRGEHGGDGLWKLDRATGALDQLVGDLNASWPVITPDDRNVVFISARSGMQAPWIVPLAGGEPTQIVDAFAGAGAALSVSSDGRLLFASAAPGNLTTFVVCDLPACAKRQDFPVPLNAAGLARWMPDGREIAYHGRDGNLWALPLDGGQARRLTSFAPPGPGTTIVDFAWSRDGQRLAIMRTKVADDIVLFRDLEP